MGCHFLLQGNLPNPGIEPGSPASQADSLLPEPPGKVSDVMEQKKAHHSSLRAKLKGHSQPGQTSAIFPPAPQAQVSLSAGRDHPSWALLTPRHLSRMPLVQRKSSDALRPNSNASFQ